MPEDERPARRCVPERSGAAASAARGSWRSGKVRRPRSAIAPYVDRLLREFADENAESCPELHVAGSWRRGADPVGDIDVIVVNAEGRLARDLLFPGVILPSCVHWQRAGDKIANGSIVMPDGAPLYVDVWACTPMQRGAFLAFSTGPQELNLRQRSSAKSRGLALSQNGVFDRKTGRQIDDGTEEGVYAAIGWDWISPEARQGWAR